MSEPKPFASLGPTLLARKGGARPAMRPQLAPLTGMGTPADNGPSPDEALEDLGWNDMGPDAEDVQTPQRQARLYSLTPAPHLGDFEPEVPVALESELAHAEPEVLRQRREVSATIEAEVRDPERRRKAAEPGRRAAFTLRLDAQRHLKLRLASTVKNRSAQQLVTEALDTFLAQIPEIEALAAQVSATDRQAEGRKPS